MTQITLDIPDEAFPSQYSSLEALTQAIRLAAAIYWYARGEISQGKAAQLAGLNRKEFLEVLDREKVDVFLVDFDDLKQELARG
jgi:predicted HTH domain antitoxin